MSQCRVKLKHNNDVAVTENVTNTETNYVNAVTVQSSVCNVDVHPLFQPYCKEGSLVHQNGAQTSINILRDTAALQSLLRSSAVPEDAVIHTGDVRWIRGISGEIIDVPLVQVHLKCDLFDSLVEVCLISLLPDGVDFLLGNDLCSQFTPVGMSECVVTRSMTRTAQQLSNDITSELNDGAIQDVHRLFLKTLVKTCMIVSLPVSLLVNVPMIAMYIVTLLLLTWNQLCLLSLLMSLLHYSRMMKR